MTFEFPENLCYNSAEPRCVYLIKIIDLKYRLSRVTFTGSYIMHTLTQSQEHGLVVADFMSDIQSGHIQNTN